MKKLILIPLLALFTSCAVLENSFNLDKAPQLINKVVPSAVTIGVKKQPKSEPYLRALVTVLNTFALGMDLSPKALEQAIKTANINELETVEALAVQTSVIALYNAYFGAIVTNKIAENKQLVDIISALSTAIEKGLAGFSPQK